MKKVVLMTNEYTYNGAGMVLLQLARYLVEVRHWQVSVFSLDSQEGDLKEQFREMGVLLPDKVVGNQYDLAVVNIFGNGSAIPLLAPHTKTIFWVHEGAFPLTTPRMSHKTIQEWFLLAHKIVFDHEFQINQVFASYLYKIPKEKCRVISPGIPQGEPLPAPQPRRPGWQRILFVGGVYARKRPQDLIQAVATLQDVQVECVLIGWTEYIHTIGQQAQDLLAKQPDRFTVLGNVSRQTLLSYFQASDLFCLPSQEETFGISPLEAASHGLPVILSDLPAYEGIWNHGVNCLLYPTGDVTMLAWMIRMLLAEDSLAKRLGQAGKVNTKRYSMAEFYRNWERVLEECDCL
ncbi:MAG: glycosyltransferase family 4 protein [Magnetococcales bacterium]|nr:glycosyltransferase family 4 protein [Magnetococcales bacterium]NGZ25704.1 glycosyltransferase family 4 protein [Magnetococcales bacterium]